MKISAASILLTGATGGIGRAAALELSHQGAQIIAVGRKELSLQTLINELNMHTQKTHYYVCADITDTLAHQTILDQLGSLKLKPNILINMAGSGQLAIFECQTHEAIAGIINTNVTGTILLTQALLPLLKQHDEALIVNIGSIFGSLGYPGQSVYCASKFALRGFSEALRRELSDTGVRVKYFAPRATKTRFNSEQCDALNRELGNSIDNAEVVVKALSKFIFGKKYRQYIGVSEKIFIALNSLFPTVINQALRRQLPLIKSHALTPYSEKRANETSLP